MNEKINLIVKTIKEKKRKIIKTMIKLMIVLGVIGVIIAGIFYEIGRASCRERV